MAKRTCSVEGCERPHAGKTVVVGSEPDGAFCLKCGLRK